VKPAILLSFDVEEFDMPLEYGFQIDPVRQLEIGHDGLQRIMPFLSLPHIQTTLFTTAHFAGHYPGIIRSLSERHEIASHTWHHSRFETADLLSARLRLEEITGAPVNGLRMPRMRAIPMPDVIAAGYTYDASLHPTWLPGRYNNLDRPRIMHREAGMLRLPASVSPLLRIPLFWLGFKNYPYSYYLHLVRRVLRSDGYASLYCHPWEFTDVHGYGLPEYTIRGCRGRLLERLHRLSDDLKDEADFKSMRAYIAAHQSIVP
jgi:peptidoglycan/xylan/chitin deacetylase (PgdA/CDA1 family)